MALPIPKGKLRNATSEYRTKRAWFLSQGVDREMLDEYMPAVNILSLKYLLKFGEVVDAQEYSQALIDVCKRLPKAGEV